MGEERHAVVVVAEGKLLALPGAAGHVVELDPVRPHRLPPLGDDLPVVSRGDGHRVEGVGRDGLEIEGVAGGTRREGPERASAGYEGRRAKGDAAAEETAPRDGPLHEPAEIRLQRTRVVDLVELVEGELARPA